MTYTTNLMPNPGLQLGLASYSTVNNSSINQSVPGSSRTLLGNPAVEVVTPGVIAGEGLLTPAATVVSNVTHSASVYVAGTTGTEQLTVSVIQNPGGMILGTAPVSLTTSYQRVVINGLTPTVSDTLSLLIATNDAEADTFWVANVQVEPESPAQAYCDGGQYGCFWTSSVLGSTSFQPYQNTLTTISNIIDGPGLVTALIVGETFTVTVNRAVDTDNENLINNATAPGPIGAMTDFSISSFTGDNDPAQTYASYNNAGLTIPSGTASYARSQGIFFPPQDYFVSGGAQLYKRAAYMAVGFQINNMPNNAKVTMADVQAEILPYSNGFLATNPTAFVPPRQIETIVKANRQNFVPNPSFDIDLTGWSAVGSGVLSQDGSTSVGSIITIDDLTEQSGQASMNVATTNNTGDGAQITIPNLIAGDTYIVSAYVQAGTSVTDIDMAIANAATSVTHGNSGTGYGGPPPYGGGFYGGNPPPSSGPSIYGAGSYGAALYGIGSASNPLATGTWFRIFTTFQPTDSSAVLTFTCVATAATQFWIDAVMVEAGQVLGFYFDGSFGENNYYWGGATGLSQSYFYDQFFVKGQAVTNVLAHHTPYGISYAPPLFNTPYTQ